MLIKHVTISPVIKHTGTCYGFKLTFLDKEDAKQAKLRLEQWLNTRGYNVTVRTGRDG